MEKAFIENLRALAGVGNYHVSLQNLMMLGEKYNLSDTEMETMKHYCKEHAISIYDEEALPSSEEDTTESPIVEKQEERTRLVNIITDRIMHLAAVKALKRVNGRGWLCGTYMNSVKRILVVRVGHIFTPDQLFFVSEHLPAETDHDEAIMIQDPEHELLCSLLNDKLNSIIPKLHVNRFYSDVFIDK